MLFLHSNDFHLTLVLLVQACNSSTWEVKEEKPKFKASKGYTGQPVIDNETVSKKQKQANEKKHFRNDNFE